jgi:hypothetical protein
VTVALNSAKAITAFSFASLVPPVDGIINAGNRTISVTVPYGTDVTSLVPTIAHTGESISPDSGVSRDFTSPVTYTVTAEDTTTLEWKVTVTVAPSTAKAITAFRFNGFDPPAIGVIDPDNLIISVTVYGRDITNLAPAITHTGKSISPASGVPQNFTSPVTYTVTAEDGNTAEWTVTVDSRLLTVAEVNAYLAAASGGTTAANPVFLPAGVNLPGEWEDLLDAIYPSGKYVNLDLAGCTMTGTTFDPGGTDTNSGRIAAKKKIVSLTLPGGAESIAAGAGSSAAFANFTSLGSLSGAGIETVGDYAFSGCTGLASVNLPAATGIGDYAFSGAALTSASLPVVISIGDYAFSGAALISVSFPEAQSIGDYAFSGCTALTSVNLTRLSNPAPAFSIGGYAFSGCTALASVTILTTNFTSIGEGAFGNTGSTELTVSLGTYDPPALGTDMFSGVTVPKTVNVRVARIPPWTSEAGSFTGTDNSPKWGNGFRGGGWTSGAIIDSSKINSSISLHVKREI